jgi:hypothetical protein
MRLNGIIAVALAIAPCLAYVPLARTVSGREAATECKCYPGDRCWPTASEWKAFNATVGGRLIVNVPTGAVCYSNFNGVPTANPAKCAEAAANWSNSSWM